MMLKKKSLTAALVTICASANVLAYDPVTHAAMSAFAVERSILETDPDLLTRLGIREMVRKEPTAPFQVRGMPSRKDVYVAIDHKMYKTGNYAHEQELLDNVSSALDSQIPGDHSLKGWIMRGSVREDDNSSETKDSDESPTVFDRVFAHFFDPVNDRPLTVLLTKLGAKSRDWALVPRTTSRQSVGDSAERTNTYNIPAAREAMWRALTGQTNSGEDPTPSGLNMENESAETVRKAYWATTFRLVGNGIHLLQDMSQPQHTRNDAHSGAGCIGILDAFSSALPCIGGHDSFYEKYIAARTLRESVFVIKEGLGGTSTAVERVEIVQDQLRYDTYPIIPQFRRLAEFYGEVTGDASVTSGKGMASFSNRNFYTAGTNADTTNYSQPNWMNLRNVTIENAVDMTGAPLGGSIQVLEGDVIDFLNVNSSSARLTSVGLWNQFMTGRAIPQFSLNHYNYNDMVKHLVPRGVGYSTGFINHFFRGKLELSVPKDGIYALLDHGWPDASNAVTGGFSRLKVKVKNATADDTGSIPNPPKLRHFSSFSESFSCVVLHPASWVSNDSLDVDRTSRQ